VQLRATTPHVFCKFAALVAANDQSTESAARETCMQAQAERLVEAGEVCDGSNLDGANCSALTMGVRPRGTPRCVDCSAFDASECS
jgi:hypothetical protein